MIFNNLFFSSIMIFKLLFVASLFCQSTPKVSIPFEIYDNAGGQKILYFGLDQTATNGIDYLLGESDLPPYPPTGAFDARFLLPENGFNGSLSSWLDYRNAPAFPYSGTVEHRFRYQSMLNATEMFFKWNLPPEVTGLVQDLINGAFVNVSLQGNGTYQIINFDVFNQLKLFVYYNNIVSDIEVENQNQTDFKLEQNYPNPFNPKTVISYSLSIGGNVLLKIYDVLGNEVATLVDEEKQPGIYEVVFNSSAIRQLQSSGMYFYQIRVDASSKGSGQSFVQTKKMILLK